MAKVYLDPLASNTNFILGAAFSGGDPVAAAKMLVSEEKAGDEHMGKFVYCKQHCGVHSTGWCTVSPDQKVALESVTPFDAREEAKKLGLDDDK